MRQDLIDAPTRHHVPRQAKFHLPCRMELGINILRARHDSELSGSSVVPRIAQLEMTELEIHVRQMIQKTQIGRKPSR
jgi:hypothetical protein